MPEDVTKSCKVTFTTGYPAGTQATFTHNKQQWVAVPRDKHRAHGAITDRLLSTLAAIRDDMTRWVNDHPDDAQRVIGILERINRTDALYKELLHDKQTTVTT